MTIDTGLIDWVAEAMTPVGRVTHRPMMGGATLYCDGLVFAITGSAGGLWFKADAASDAAWDAARCPRFTMTGKDGQVSSMNYRLAPDDVHDDADALRYWAALALEASRRTPVRRKRA